MEGLVGYFLFSSKKFVCFKKQGAVMRPAQGARTAKGTYEHNYEALMLLTCHLTALANLNQQ